MTKKSTIKKVALSDLTVDPAVQRLEGVDQRRVDKMASDFQDFGLGVITASQREDGRLIVLDGMHRVTLCRQVGHVGMLWAEVFVGLTIAEEAEIFYIRNTGKLPSALTRFSARVTMGDKVAIAISNLVGEHGWKIAPCADPGYIVAIEATERLYRNGGGTVPEGEHPDLLSRVIEIVTIAWEWDQSSVNQHMLLGLGQVIGRFGAGVDTKKLLTEMQDTRPGVLVGKAKSLRDIQGGSVPAAMAKILVGMHNKKRRTNLLPEWVWIR